MKTRNIEKEVTGILYLKLVYAIIAVGKMSDVSKMTRKNPRSCSSGGFLFHLEGGLDLGLLPVIYLHQAICKYSRQLHLPEQRYKMSDVNP